MKTIFSLTKMIKKTHPKDFKNDTQNAWIVRISIFIVMGLSCYLAYNSESMKLNEFGDYWNGYIGPFLMLISLLAIYLQLDDKRKSDEEQKIKDMIYRFRQCANETQLYEGSTKHHFMLQGDLKPYKTIILKGNVFDQEQVLRKGPEFFHSFITCIIRYRFRCEKEHFSESFKKTMTYYGYLVSGYFNQLEYTVREIEEAKKQDKEKFTDELIKSMTISELVLVKLYISYYEFENKEKLKERIDKEIAGSHFMHPEYSELYELSKPTAI